MLDRRTVLKTGLAAAALQSAPLLARATKVGAPFPIYDTHAHFYTNDPARYPFRSTIAERTLIRARTHPATVETVLRFWDDAGIMMGTGVQYNSAYEYDNSYLLDACAAHPARILPIVILPPTDPSTPETLRKLVSENGIVGVRFTGLADQGGFPFLTEAALPAWEAANELGIAVVLIAYGGDVNATMGKLHEFATRFPDVRIVLDHLGFPDPAALPGSFGFTPMHHALAAHRNIYYKFTSYLMLLTLDPAGTDLKAFMHYAVDLYGPDRMIWGSDFGNAEGDHFAHLQRALDATGDMPYGTRRAMFFDTAYRLFASRKAT